MGEAAGAEPDGRKVMLGRFVLMVALMLAPVWIGPLAQPAGGASAEDRDQHRIGQTRAPSGSEVVHQVPVHDAEHALRVQGARVPDIVGSADSREAFARYVADRFLLAVDGEAVMPDYVGSENLRRQPEWSISKPLRPAQMRPCGSIRRS